MDLDGKRIVVVGGSRGLGLGMAKAFVARAAKVTVVARDATTLQALGEQLAITTVSADATSADAAKRIMSETRPDVVIMNAGAEPPMERIDRVGWEAFTTNWNVDVKAALHWVQAALTLPMASGGLVVLVSSGAAVQGSPLSGGYAGAKRAQWFIANMPRACRPSSASACVSGSLFPGRCLQGPAWATPESPAMLRRRAGHSPNRPAPGRT